MPLLPIVQSLALLMGLVGCVLIYQGWKTHSRPYAFSGWVITFMSLPLWIAAEGPEFGLIYGLCMPALFIWLGVLKEQKRQKETPDIVKHATKWSWNRRKVMANTANVLFLLPGLMIISSLLTITGVYFLPITEPSQMATGIIMLPMLWGILSYWYLATPNKRIPLSFCLLSATLCAFYLFG